MKLFIAGFFAGIIVTILSTMAFVMIWTSPTLDVVVEIPASAKMDQAFTMNIVIANPHNKKTSMGNVDVPNSVLDNFDIKSVGPKPSDDSPIGGLGTNTWYFEIEMQPMSKETITFEVTPLEKGRQIIEFEVCNATEDCSQIVRALEVE